MTILPRRISLPSCPNCGKEHFDLRVSTLMQPIANDAGEWCPATAECPKGWPRRLILLSPKHFEEVA